MDDVDRRHPVPWEWYDTLIIFLLWSLAQLVIVLLFPDGFTEESAPQATAVGLLLGASSLLLVAVGWAGWRGQMTRTPQALRLLMGIKQVEFADIGRGIAWGLGCFMVIQIGLGVTITRIIELLGREVPPVQVGVQEAAVAEGATPLLLWLGAGLIGPIAEELLFRGVLYQGLAKRLPGWPAVGLSGLAFGLLHLEGLVIALTFPFGMVLAYTMRRYGTMVVPITAHVVFNLIALVLVRAGDGLAV